MKNPWRSKSNVNPQRENGHREIANDIFREIIKADLTGAELKICLSIIHHSWGFGKLTDVLSTHTIAKETKVSLRMVKRTLKSLKFRRFIYFEPSKQVNHGSLLNEYLFNKHWDTWLPRPVHHSSPVNQIVNQQANQSSLTKEITILKKVSPPPEKIPDPRVKRIIGYFSQQFKKRTGSPPMIEGGRDGSRIKKALGTFSEEEICHRIDLFLSDNDKFIAGMTRNIPAFVSQIDRYAGTNVHKPSKGLPLEVFNAETDLP